MPININQTPGMIMLIIPFLPTVPCSFVTLRSKKIHLWPFIGLERMANLQETPIFLSIHHSPSLISSWFSLLHKRDDHQQTKLGTFAGSLQKMDTPIRIIFLISHISIYATHISTAYTAYIYIYIYINCMYVYIYMYMVQRSNPPPPRHGHGSAIVLSPSPPVVWWVCGTVPCGVVGVWYCPPPRPVVWWGCGTVPLPPCGVVRVWYCMDGRYGM